jgi:hypothetical protein
LPASGGGVPSGAADAAPLGSAEALEGAYFAALTETRAGERPEQRSHHIQTAGGSVRRAAGADEAAAESQGGPQAAARNTLAATTQHGSSTTAAASGGVAWDGAAGAAAQAGGPGSVHHQSMHKDSADALAAGAFGSAAPPLDAVWRLALPAALAAPSMMSSAPAPDQSSGFVAPAAAPGHVEPAAATAAPDASAAFPTYPARPMRMSTFPATTSTGAPPARMRGPLLSQALQQLMGGSPDL